MFTRHEVIPYNFPSTHYQETSDCDTLKLTSKLRLQDCDHTVWYYSSCTTPGVL